MNDSVILNPRERAVDEQRRASDPAVSAFVDASAGSGKTKLLTDRMLRLMLGGAEPGRIQCLTFTKAAAAEMALRLQARLGDWVTLDDDRLDAQLRELRVRPDGEARVLARSLFAAVLDLPGGMRIGTIHAFCQSLLRRFPLEAALSPHFELVEEVDAAAAMQAAREGVLEHADPADVSAVAALLRAEEFGPLMAALQNNRARLAPLLALPPPARAAAIRRAAGAPGDDAAVLAAAAADWPAVDALRDALRLAEQHGSPAVRTRAACMLAWLSMPPAQRAVHWADWLDHVFTGSGAPRALSTYAAEKLHKLHPEIRDVVAAEQERVVAAEEARRAVRCAEATAALLHLAAPSLAAYENEKNRAGLLDYADLIDRAEKLLIDPGAAWVLFKLDGGIDHLLLDEVQDTAPEQWAIAHKLTEEFFAGAGARDDGRVRTFFAVGDPKQSIYSFQGADPAEFARSRERMAERVASSGQTWRAVPLDVSFRSTEPVLGLVDAVFADPVAGQGVVAPGGDPLRHFPNRAGEAGAVELWPLAVADPDPGAGDPDTVSEAAGWDIPDENQGLRSAPQLLAEALAASVAAELAAGTRLPSRDRPLNPGDYLVLVRSRGPFASALVRALKARDVPVAGLDRLRLTEQIAVQDVLAALDAVLLPQDCLAVANLLTSPLGFLTDESLMQLALGRPGRLWDTLRARREERADWRNAWSFLHRLAERADYVTPHALLAEMLGPMGGRARLLARLGAEAAEPIDELLNAALLHGRQHPPGLQDFVHWLRRSGAEVKREAGAAGAAVRVMTVHGAKGLQAPVVILPDTTGLPPDKERLAWVDDVPLWSPRRELNCAAVASAREHAARLRQEEYNRLLYVALTRAEDRLVVCGWAGGRAKAGPDGAVSAPENSWYAACARGFERLGAAPRSFAAFTPDGTLLRHEAAQRVPPAAAPRAAGAVGTAPLPAWAGRPGRWTPAPPPEEPPLPRPLAPSRPDGAAFGPLPPAASPLLLAPGPRYARGLAAHSLLQHLPDLPPAERAAAARAHLAHSTLPPAEREGVVAEVLAVMAHPSLAPLFGPGGRAEQPLSGLVDGVVVSGVVDRMAVLPDAVLLADFKTGRGAPATAEDTPVRYLRQLAAYRAVLRRIFPDRPVRCALVWTEDAAVTPIPDTLLDAHAPGQAPPSVPARDRA